MDDLERWRRDGDGTLSGWELDVDHVWWPGKDQGRPKPPPFVIRILSDQPDGLTANVAAHLGLHVRADHVPGRIYTLVLPDESLRIVYTAEPEPSPIGPYLVKSIDRLGRMVFVAMRPPPRDRQPALLWEP